MSNKQFTLTVAAMGIMYFPCYIVPDERVSVSQSHDISKQ